eukprot:3903672-Rhodomonas_salina.1
MADAETQHAGVHPPYELRAIVLHARYAKSGPDLGAAATRHTPSTAPYARIPVMVYCCVYTGTDLAYAAASRGTEFDVRCYQVPPRTLVLTARLLLPVVSLLHDVCSVGGFAYGEVWVRHKEKVEYSEVPAYLRSYPCTPTLALLPAYLPSYPCATTSLSTLLADYQLHLGTCV